MFEMLVVFNNRDLPSTSWGKTNGNRLYVLAISQATVTNNSKALLCLVLGFLLDELLLLEKALLVQMGKLYSNYLCIFISGLTSIIGSFSWTINCVILDFFQTFLLFFCPYFSVFISHFLLEYLLLSHFLHLITHVLLLFPTLLFHHSPTLAGVLFTFLVTVVTPDFVLIS